MDLGTALIDQEAITGSILIVDDTHTIRVLHRAILAHQFDVSTASSGQEALDMCAQRVPDLILLDIEMPGMDGIETCRRLRETTSVPIIFATGHDSFDLHLRAYEAGANDIVTKPVQPTILLRKAALAIQQFRTASQLTEERDSLQSMAMKFLSSMGETGALLHFLREAMGCRNHLALARKVYDCLVVFGLSGSVLIKHAGGTEIVTPRGEATELERSIIEHASTMGRIFQFRQRLAVNFPHVTIVIDNVPNETVDAEGAGKVRDNVALLAEAAEGLCENVDMRIESMARAEQMQLALSGGVAAVENLRGKYLAMLGDTRLLLQALEDQVHSSFAWLGATELEERNLSQKIDTSVTAVLYLLAEGGDFEREFSNVLAALRGDSGSADVELF